MNVVVVDEKFFTNAEFAGLRDFARCGECLARIASGNEGQSLMGEEAAAIQWARCAQCRSGTAPWYRR